MQSLDAGCAPSRRAAGITAADSIQGHGEVFIALGQRDCDSFKLAAFEDGDQRPDCLRLDVS